jgi:hypothetical protein
MKVNNLDDVIKNIFPILCYSSIIFFPIIFVKEIYHFFMHGDFLKLFSWVFSNVPLEFNLVSVIKYVVVIPIALIVFFWWIWLVATGIKVSKVQSKVKLKKAIVLSCLLFFCLQLVTSLVYSTVENWQFLKGFKIIYFKDIEKELSRHPPNYFKAGLLAGTIADNEKYPDYLRYIFKLTKITCMIANPKFQADKNLITNALKALEEKKYAYLQKILSEHIKTIKTLSSEEIDTIKKTIYIERIIYTSLTKEIEQVEKIRNSPSFIDLGESFTISVGFADIPKDLNLRYIISPFDKTITFFLIVEPSFIALFP